MTVLQREWRSVALEMVEQVAGAPARKQALHWIFGTLRRQIDFDCASAVSLEGAEYLAVDKPELCKLAWTANSARYLEEGLPVVKAAGGRHGVILDREVLSARARGRLSFYDEYMRPLGASSSVMLMVQSGPSITQILSITRTGGSSFRGAELEALRMLLPSISVAARVFPGVTNTNGPMNAPLSPLTAREAEIVGYLVRGLQNAEIAACLGTSKNTVRNQIHRLFRKLDVTTRAELVALVLANGWVRGFHQSGAD